MAPETVTWPEIVVCGYGRVGTALAMTFASAGRTVMVVELPAVVREGKFFPDGILNFGAVASVPTGPVPRVWFLCVPDSALPDIVTEMAASGSPFDASRDCCAVVSATYDTEGLSAILGATVGRAHPLQPFPPADQAVDVPPGTPFATHGLPPHAIRLLSESGFRPFALDPENRYLYHAAAVLTSNLPAALACRAAGIFAACGVPDADLHATAMLTNLASVLRQDGINAVPGPASRGDQHTVAADQNALDKVDPELGLVHRILTDVIREMIFDCAGTTTENDEQE